MTNRSSPSSKSPSYAPASWRDSAGQPIACEEKIKVLNENLVEMYTLCQELLEDAVLMGCDEKVVREVLHHAIDCLRKPFDT